MNFLAGVDEAGLGPILGPLVVAGVAMTGPEGTDPWRLLAELVCRERQQKGKIRVADSKKVKQGPHGLRRLEETSLAFWAARHGELPSSLEDWLVALGADLALLRRCPWYENLSLPLPLLADRDACELRGELIRRKLEAGGVALVDLVLRPVDVEEWNDLIAETDNKSRAHFRAYSEVIGRLLEGVRSRGDDHDQRQLVADRCGGRAHYRDDLRRLCPDASVQTIRETPGFSSYRLHRPEAGDVTVTFAERGEERAFPTALASCFAKYLRELMITVLNRWFAERIPDLRPTAGYYVDGHRFLDDVEEQVRALGLPRGRLVRVR